MRSLVCCSRSALLGLTFAMAAFCFAIATTSRDTTVTAEDRGVGSFLPLRYTNPNVLVKGVASPEFDLGDVAATQIITRYISAEGGLKPYRFTSSGTQSLDAAVGATDSTLTLGLSGVVSGRMASRVPAVSLIMLGSSSYLTTPGTPGFRFKVSLQDAKGTSGDIVNGFFNLFFVPADAFKFCIDALPTGRAQDTYMTKVETIGAAGTPTISVVSISGAATTQKDLGLSIGSDGTIFGKPLVTGTVTIVLHAVDSKNNVALNRAKTAPDQSLTLVINANPVTSSDMVTTSCSVSGDTSKTGGDRLSYKGIVNVLGQDNFAIASSVVTFHLGGISFTGTLDKRGSFKATLADLSVVSAKINASSGTFSISISKGTFSKVLNATTFKDGDKTREALAVVVGDAVSTTEVLDFATKVNGTKYALNYRLGSTGSNVGGAFQVVKVLGKDQTGSNGAAADKFNVGFIALAPIGLGTTQGTNNATTAQLRIGTNFIAKLPATGNAANGFSFRGNSGSLVRNLKLTSKTGKGTFSTAALAPSQTGLQPAAQSLRFGNIFFPVGLDLTRSGTTFTGEHARRIFGLRNTYVDVPPKR